MMANAKKNLTQSQPLSQRRGSIEEGIRTIDPNLLVLEELRKMRAEMKELRTELKEDIKESNKELREEMKETRAEIRKDFKRELDNVVKRMDKMNLEMNKTQKDVEKIKERTSNLEGSVTDLRQKQDYQQRKELYQDLKYRDKCVKVRGILEKPNEDLYELLLPPLAVFLGYSVEKMESECDKIFRINSVQAREKNYPRDIIICCTRTRVRDLIIQKSYDSILMIEDKEAKIYKDIPPSIMLARQKYRGLINLLRYLKVEYRWDRVEGVSFIYRQKRIKIDTLEKAKEMEIKLRRENKTKQNGLLEKGVVKNNRDETDPRKDDQKEEEDIDTVEESNLNDPN